MATPLTAPATSNVSSTPSPLASVPFATVTATAVFTALNIVGFNDAEI